MASLTSDAGIVTINVGGEIFQTTTSTLSKAPPSSPLSTTPLPFFDRDPDLFRPLLSYLRTSHFPSDPSPSLLAEAAFFGLNPPKHPFSPFTLSRTLRLPLNGPDPPSAISVSDSLHVAHGGKMTSFSGDLRRKSTVLTPFPAVDSLLEISPSAVAAGAVDFPHLRVLNLPSGSVSETLTWEPHPTGESTVQAIEAARGEILFGSFESSRRTASAIVAFDLAGGGFRRIAEFGRKDVYGAELDSAIPSTKLRWMENWKLLMSGGAHSGPSGRAGSLRLWDLRSDNRPIWEWKEREDCFSDVAVVDEMGSLFEVGSESGEVRRMDLRRMGEWVGVGGRGMDGKGCRMEGYEGLVWCGRGGDVEVWSEVGMVEGESVVRRNVLGSGRGKDSSRILEFGFGGNRMGVLRKDQMSVEVWECAHN